MVSFCQRNNVVIQLTQCFPHQKNITFSKNGHHQFFQSAFLSVEMSKQALSVLDIFEEYGFTGVKLSNSQSKIRYRETISLNSEYIVFGTLKAVVIFKKIGRVFDEISRHKYVDAATETNVA